MLTIQDLCEYLLVNWNIKENEWEIDERTGAVVFNYVVTRRFCQREIDYMTEAMLQILPAGVAIWFNPNPESIKLSIPAQQWFARWGRR